MQRTAEDFFIIRADHTFSPKDRIFATYVFDKASQSIPDQYDSLLLHNPMFRQTVAIEENHVFTTSLLNSIRVGFNRDNVESPSGATAINPAAGDTSLGFIPGTTIGNITINSDGLAGYPGGVDVQAPFKFHWNSIQAYDNLFLTKGKHSLKFGANIERLRGNTFGADFPGGQLIFNSLYDFLTNDRAAVNADVPGLVTGRGVRQTIFGAYIQDDYHVRSNLSVNIGLRYEMASIITEEAGKLANLRSVTPVLNDLKPVVGTPGPGQAEIFVGSPYINNPTKRNFEPRVGFAWDPFGNGKTSVAGGFGIFDVLPLPVEMGSGVDGSVPFDVGASSGQASTAGGAMQLGCSTPCGVYGQALANQSGRNYVMDFNPRRNYVMQWNFNIQREILPNTSIMIGVCWRTRQTHEISSGRREHGVSGHWNIDARVGSAYLAGSEHLSRAAVGHMRGRLDPILHRMSLARGQSIHGAHSNGSLGWKLLLQWTSGPGEEGNGPRLPSRRVLHFFQEYG